MKKAVIIGGISCMCLVVVTVIIVILILVTQGDDDTDSTKTPTSTPVAGSSGKKDTKKDEDYQTTSSVILGKETSNNRRIECPSGEHVTEIFGTAGRLVDSVGVKCSGGKTTTKVGGRGGEEYSQKSTSGFESINMKHGSQIDSIALDGGMRIGGTGGPHTVNHKCEDDGKIKGFDVHLHDNGKSLYGLKVFCLHK